MTQNEESHHEQNTHTIEIIKRWILAFGAIFCTSKKLVLVNKILGKSERMYKGGFKEKYYYFLQTIACP